MTQLDMKTREVELIEERLKQGSHHQKVEEVEAFKASIGRFIIHLYTGNLSRTIILASFTAFLPAFLFYIRTFLKVFAEI